MTVSEDLVVDAGGLIRFSQRIIDRYNLAPDTQLRVVETRCGILLIPLIAGPMSEELQAELADWQALARRSLDSFPSRRTLDPT
jgi:hypothetical protein